MSAFLAAVGIAILAYFLASAFELITGNRSLPRLDQIVPDPSVPHPRVSVIVAARQEADTIEPALASVLAQDYPNYEVIAINDRSEDATGAILDRMAAAIPSRLSVVHVKELPPGWLGKNHALYLGTERASGTIYLFTDADVVMAPDTLSRAVARMQQAKADHVVVIPRIVTPHMGVEAFVSLFVIGFGLWYHIWKAPNPRSKFFVGIGAFNMVHAEVYRRAGTHRAIALRPDDDMKLGKLIKLAGFRQDLVNGIRGVSVAWYPSLRALVAGLMKNAFAGLDYRLWKLAAAVCFIGLVRVWPWAALAVTHGPVRAIYLAIVGLILAMAWDNARFNRFHPWIGLLEPFAACLLIFIVLRSAAVTLRQGGIRWRGTLYPLDELRSNNV